MLASSPMIRVSGSDQNKGTSARISKPTAGPTLTINDSVVNAPPETLKNITATRERVVRERRRAVDMTAEGRAGPGKCNVTRHVYKERFTHAEQRPDTEVRPRVS